MRPSDFLQPLQEKSIVNDDIAMRMVGAERKDTKMNIGVAHIASFYANLLCHYF